MRLPVVLALFVLSGCALTRNAPPLQVQYFDVEAPRTTTLRSATPPSAPRALAIGRVRSSEFLRNRIVHREANDVLGVYETLRWTEYPEAYLRRALTHVLFEDERFVQSLGRDVPTLDVELVAFEEVRHEGARAGRVQVEYRLHVGDHVLATDVVTAEHEATSEGGMPPVVAALEVALAEVTNAIARAVDAAIRAQTASPVSS